MVNSLEISVQAVPASANLARAAVHSTYADSLPAVALQDLKAIVTELVTNSCRYGPGDPIRVRIGARGQAVLEGEVDDHGRTVFAMEEIRNEGGLGLHIVDALASEWEVDPAGGSVRFVLPAG